MNTRPGGWAGAPTSLSAALRCRCPRCGLGPLYAGVLRVAPTCRACGLDLRAEAAGDGPAAFLIFFIGALAMGGVLWLEFTQEPPVWVHLVLWPPVVVGLTVAGLRPLKAWMIARQLRNDAGEARAVGP